jgi:hypothetical protein
VLNSKEARARAEANFKKKEMKTQEAANAWAEYQAESRAVAEKTERLRALRLAKQAAEATTSRRDDDDSHRIQEPQEGHPRVLARRRR